MDQNLKTIYALCLFSILLLVQKGCAYEFKVGGSNGWTVPSDSNALNQWAERSRFQMGDTLLFVYPADEDVMLQVNKDDYTNCNTATPIAKYTDGNTVFKFNQSGPFYFISGVKDHCLKNEKLLLVVMADRSQKSPPPSTDASAQPPAAPTETTPPLPSPAPSADQTPPPSGANTMVTSFIGAMGAFLGSSVLLVL